MHRKIEFPKRFPNQRSNFSSIWMSKLNNFLSNNNFKENPDTTCYPKRNINQHSARFSNFNQSKTNSGSKSIGPCGFYWDQRWRIENISTNSEVPDPSENSRKTNRYQLNSPDLSPKNSTNSDMWKKIHTKEPIGLI